MEDEKLDKIKVNNAILEKCAETLEEIIKTNELIDEIVGDE